MNIEDGGEGGLENEDECESIAWESDREEDSRILVQPYFDVLWQNGPMAK